ncbi:MAG: hypothetical protein WCT10_03730 [Patescibacteria group bacterium]|jgi:hypothetical protein
MPNSPIDRPPGSGATGEFEHIDRLVGASDREIEVEAQCLAASGSEAPEVKIGDRRLEFRETEKTERDRQIIGLASAAVDALMREYGRERTVEIPDENLHLVEAQADISGFYDPRRRQLAVARKPGHDAKLAADLFHELVHAKSYNALRVKDVDDREVEYYRTGLLTVSREGRTHFRDLNEAVVQTLTLDFFDQVVEKNELFRDEMFMPGRSGGARGHEEGIYWAERYHFQALTRALWERDREQAAAGGEPRFGNEEEVKQMFFRASVTGNLLEVGRVVEAAWGPGSLRKLGLSLEEFCRENIYTKRGPGLIDSLIQRLKKPVKEVGRKCSELISDNADLAKSLFDKLRPPQD